jgi:hypothetical protein
VNLKNFSVTIAWMKDWEEGKREKLTADTHVHLGRKDVGIAAWTPPVALVRYGASSSSSSSGIKTSTSPSVYS